MSTCIHLLCTSLKHDLDLSTTLKYDLHSDFPKILKHDQKSFVLTQGTRTLSLYLSVEGDTYSSLRLYGFHLACNQRLHISRNRHFATARHSPHRSQNLPAFVPISSSPTRASSPTERNGLARLTLPRANNRQLFIS